MIGYMQYAFGLTPNENDKYNLTLDGQLYENISLTYLDMGDGYGIYCSGNLALAGLGEEDTGEDYFFAAMNSQIIVCAATEGEHTVSLEMVAPMNEKIHKLDNKYLDLKVPYEIYEEYDSEGRDAVAFEGDVIINGYRSINTALDNVFNLPISQGEVETSTRIGGWMSNSRASGENSTSSGYGTHASGKYSFTEGNDTRASGDCAHSEGKLTVAAGQASHAEGEGGAINNVYGSCQISIIDDSRLKVKVVKYEDYMINLFKVGCRLNYGSGMSSSDYFIVTAVISNEDDGIILTSDRTVYGLINTSLNAYIYGGAFGDNSHAEGYGTVAAGYISHAEGARTIASGSHSHAEGLETKSLGDYSHAEGYKSEAIGENSHAEGGGTASGEGSHAEGSGTASSNYSHAEGTYTQASGECSHAEGNYTVASGNSSHAEGYNTAAEGDYSHSEGWHPKAGGQASHAEGYMTKAMGNHSHAEGRGGIVAGYCAHREGCGDEPDHFNFENTKVHIDCGDTNITMEVFGVNLTTSNYSTKYFCAGNVVHLIYYNNNGVDECFSCKIENVTYSESDNSSLITGILMYRGNFYSGNLNDGTAEFVFNSVVTIGEGAHSEGLYTFASGNGQHVEGRYNAAPDNMYKYLHITGNGTSDSKRSNAYTLDENGNAWYAGSVEAVNGLIVKSSTSGSTKRFKITIDDNGTISAQEVY